MRATRQARSEAWLADLRDGPGPWGRKWSRDAESLARHPSGHGWWVGYEQNHALWLYDGGFRKALNKVDLGPHGWFDNRGAEGLLANSGRLLAIGENGRDIVSVRPDRIEGLVLAGLADVADAATAPDGSNWLLLRSKRWNGIVQSIAPLLEDGRGFRAGPAMSLPKAAFDNYEGMAIEARPGGGWRFWLITDDGHRLMARTWPTE